MKGNNIGIKVDCIFAEGLSCKEANVVYCDVKNKSFEIYELYYPKIFSQNAR